MNKEFYIKYQDYTLFNNRISNNNIIFSTVIKINFN